MQLTTIGTSVTIAVFSSALLCGQTPELSEEDRTFVEVHFLAAKRAEAARQLEDAAREYRLILNRVPERLPQVYHNLGLIYYASRKCELAVAALDRANRLMPDAGAATHLVLGMALLCLDQPTKALPELQTAFRLQPGGETAVQLGQAYTALDKPDSAARYLRVALDTSTTREYALYILGDNYFKQAKQVAEDLINRNPDSRYDNLVVARIFDREEFYQVAAKAYLAAVQKDPWNAPALLRFARVLAILGHKDAAGLLLERYHRLLPSESEVRLDEQHAKSPAAEGVSRYEPAIRALPRVEERDRTPLPLVESGANDILRVRLASDRSGAWKLALRQFETHQLPQAIATLKTIPATPENWMRDYLIATACLLRNDVTGAEEVVNGRLLASHKTPLVQMLRWEILEALAHFYFGRLLDDFPNSCRGHLVKARILDAQGKKEAIDEYRAAIAADPKQPGIRLALAESYVGASRLKEALEECKRELELNPASSAAKARIGRIYTDLRQADEAIPYLEDALRKAPEDPDAHAALGRAHELRGEDQKAATEYSRALALNPGLNRLHYVLAELYRRLGKDALAQREFDLFQQAGIAERQQHVESVQRYYGGRQSRDQGR